MYHTKIVFRLINTKNPRVRNISKVTKLFEEGSDNYKQIHKKEINPIEEINSIMLSWPKS